MATTAHEGGSVVNGSAPRPKEEIELEIADTRDELAHTVEELADRFDVRSRAAASASRLLQRGRNALRDNPVRATGVTAAVIAPLVGLVLWRRRR